MQSDNDFEEVEVLDDDSGLESASGLEDNHSQVGDSNSWELLKEDYASDWLQEFTSEAGPQSCNLKSNSHPFEFFSLIFKSDLFTSFCKWTNKRTRANIDNEKRKLYKKKEMARFECCGDSRFCWLLIHYGNN